MSTHVGKKFVLLSPEVYNSLLEKSKEKADTNILSPPEKIAMQTAEKEMSNVWERTDLPEDEKVKIFTRELNSMKRYQNSLVKPQEDSIKRNEEMNEKENITDENDKNTQQAFSIENILHVLPKSIRKEAQQILRFMKSSPAVMSWNKDRELIFEGSTLHGSNIADLLLDTLSNRKKMVSPTLFRNTFSKGLLKMDVPKEWIKNDQMKYLFEIDDKENKLSKTFRRKRTRSTPYAKNIKVNTSSPSIKWLSSTSKVR